MLAGGPVACVEPSSADAQVGGLGSWSAAYLPRLAALESEWAAAAERGSWTGRGRFTRTACGRATREWLALLVGW